MFLNQLCHCSDDPTETVTHDGWRFGSKLKTPAGWLSRAGFASYCDQIVTITRKETHNFECLSHV